MPNAYIFTEEQKQQIINDYIKNQMSYREIKEKYNIKSNSVVQKLLKDYARSKSESNKLAHLKHPESFKHSEESKEKIRQARLKFMKDHPEQTAWRKSNMSYPEQQFQRFLEDYGYVNKYLIERELSVFPYFIDFAFTDLKIAIEIDGSQHLEEDRKLKDIKKDEVLQNNGWKVIRIAENVIKTDWNKLKEILDKFIILNDNSVTFERVGIIKASKKKQYIKKERNEQGLTEKQLKRYKEHNWKTIDALPNKDLLLEQITNNSFAEVGRIYNVTGNTIKRWCKRLGLPSTKYELEQRSMEKISDKVCENYGIE